MQIDNTLKQNLEKEEPILLMEIRALYAKFDRQFHLNSGSIPITFGFDTDTLGSYTQESFNTDEEFHFCKCQYMNVQKVENKNVHFIR